MFDPTLAAFRFGFGLPLPQEAPQSQAQMLAALDQPDVMAHRFTGPTTAVLAPLRAEAQKAERDTRRTRDSANRAEAKAAAELWRKLSRDLAKSGAQAAKSMLARAVETPDGLRERLVWFWANHFSTTAPDRRTLAVPMTLIDEAIRPHLTAPFAQMLTAATLHPAMLDYLDQSRSIGPHSRRGSRNAKGLNENLARELLELHTMGAGSGYAQTDVQELAELLTGVTTGPGGMEFDPDRAEPGAERVLGRTYGSDAPADLGPIRAFLADIATRPETARFVTGKLAVHFLGPTLGTKAAPDLARVWVATGGNLKAVVTALIQSPHAWTAGAENIRRPAEFLVAACRALGLSGAQVARMGDGPFQRLLLQPMEKMGQPFGGPPGPDGWTEDPAYWITPQGMTTRILWATLVPGRLVQPLPDPATVMARALGPRASAALIWAVPRADSPRQAVGLIFAAPEFNRR